MTFAKRSLVFWLGLFLAGFGAIFLAVGWTVMRRERQYEAEGRVGEAIVITKAIERATRSGSSGRRTSTEYNVTYRFTAPDGRPYQGRQDVSISTWDRLREQEPVQIQYVASDPSTSRIAGESSERGGYVFAAIGLVAALIGAALLGRSVSSANHKARIWSQGTPADAIVSAVDETNVKINRRTMWVVRYQYRDHSGNSHDGTSEYLAREKANAWKTGDSIRVRFDPQKPDMSVWVE
jgi:hypothetical protein